MLMNGVEEPKKVTTEDGVETTIDDWSFSYKYVEKPNMADGTIIKISNLNSEVVDLFADDSFSKRPL